MYLNQHIKRLTVRNLDYNVHTSYIHRLSRDSHGVEGASIYIRDVLSLLRKMPMIHGIHFYHNATIMQKKDMSETRHQQYVNKF